MASHKEEDFPVPHQTKSLASDRLQRSANILTILVALVAIGLSIWEGRENRLHNRLSVLPHLKSIESISRSGVDDSTFTMTYALDNNGLGPAVLKSVRVYRDQSIVYDSRMQEDNFDFKHFLGELDTLPFQVSSFTHGRKAGEMLRANTEHLFFRLEVPVTETLDQWSPGIVLDEVINHYSFVFCYCSVYDEHCGSSFLGSKPPDPNVCKH